MADKKTATEVSKTTKKTTAAASTKAATEAKAATKKTATKKTLRLMMMPSKLSSKIIRRKSRSPKTI